MAKINNITKITSHLTKILLQMRSNNGIVTKNQSGTMFMIAIITAVKDSLPKRETKIKS